MLPITHVLFDLDDLLIDSEMLFDATINEILKPYNLEVTYEFKECLMGKSNREFIHQLIEVYDIPLSEDKFIDLYYEMRPKILKDIKLKPGAMEVVRHFWEHGIPMAIATGSSDQSYSLKVVDHPNLFSKIDHAVCSGSDKSVKRTKPAPDVFIEAARRFRVKPLSPRNILVFEDAANGIKGALAASMRAIWVPDTRADKSIFQNHPDVTILESLLEFCPRNYLIQSRDDFYVA